MICSDGETISLRQGVAANRFLIPSDVA